MAESLTGAASAPWVTNPKLAKLMSKIKTLVFIVIGSLIHFGLMVKVIVDRLSCDAQPYCVSLINKIGGAVLAFPLGLITAPLHYFGVDVGLIRFLGGGIFVLYFINSILAVTLAWIVFSRLLVRWQKRSKP